MLPPAPPPRRRTSYMPALLALLLAGTALPLVAHASAVPTWTEELVLAPGDLHFGNGSLRTSTLDQPHIACYKDSTGGLRTLVYASRVAANQWHVEYLITTGDLAGPDPADPGPWLGLDENAVPTIIYTRQTANERWSVWRATKTGGTWAHLQIAIIYPPIQFDATVDDFSTVHWFALNQGVISDTLTHSSYDGSPHLCSAIITPGSNVFDPRWMAGAVSEFGDPVAFVLSDFDPFFGTGSVRVYSHPNGGLALDAAFRNEVALPGPFLIPPVSAAPNIFGGVTISGGPTALIEGGGGSWLWNTDNDHPVYELGPFGETQDLAYVADGVVIYSYVADGPDYRTVLTPADVFLTWAYSVEGSVSGLTGTPSLSAHGLFNTLITAVEDFTASRRIRFRSYGPIVVGVDEEKPRPAATSLRAWPQPARSGGELWFAGFPSDGFAEVELFDVSGRRVDEVQGTVRGGLMHAQAPRLGAGVYFARTASLKGTRVVVAE